MQSYLNLIKDIIINGEEREDRTGVGVISVFGRQLRFNLKEGFPAITTKKLAWKSVVSELLWFIEGSTDERRLCEILYGTRDPKKTTIWSENANSNYWKPNAKFEGDLGRVYGSQWRSFRSYANTGEYFETDQLNTLINGLTSDPNSRRHILNSWNAADINDNQMALPPCHVMAQFYINKRGLSCIMTQRSADIFLGVPFNIASYALLTHLLAKTIELEVDELIINLGDAHLYKNHLNAVEELSDRKPLSLPTLDILEVNDIWTARIDQCHLVNYVSHPAISAQMAV